MTDEAPEWGQGYVLTHSGKWHIPLNLGSPTALCGAEGYRQHDRILDSGGKLSDIAAGRKPAPKCRLCQRSLPDRIKTGLNEVYTPEGVQIWFTSPHLWLNGQRACDLITEGRGIEVLAAVNRLVDGAF